MARNRLLILNTVTEIPTGPIHVTWFSRYVVALALNPMLLKCVHFMFDLKNFRRAVQQSLLNPCCLNYYA